MKNIILFLILSFTINSFSQEFKMMSNETLESFAIRCKANDSAELTGKVIQANWNGMQNSIFAFYSDKEIENIKGKNTEVEFVEGYVFINISQNFYKRIYIDRFFPDGAEAEIESIFFANADKDKKKELIILYSWNQDRHAYPISGKSYQVYFYDNLNYKKLPEILTNINLEKKFPPEFDGTNDANEIFKAKYTNAVKIKKKLKLLGF